MIKTATTYIFAFEIKNMQLCSDMIADATEFTYKVHSGKTENATAMRYVQRKNSDLSNWAAVNEKVQGNAGGQPAMFTDRETKLLAMVAEFFQQQEFFDNENKQKKYEEDKSETFKSESNDDENQDSPSPGEMNGGKNMTNSNSDDQQSKSSQTLTSSTGRSNSIASNADSFKQGGIEENLTGLPNKLYLPSAFKRLRILALFMILLSMVSTIVVLVYDFIFNSELTTSIAQQNILQKLDGLLLKDCIVFQLLFLSYRKNLLTDTFESRIKAELENSYQKSGSITPRVNFDDFSIGEDKVLDLVIGDD